MKFSKKSYALLTATSLLVVPLAVTALPNLVSRPNNIVQAADEPTKTGEAVMDDEGDWYVDGQKVLMSFPKEWLNGPILIDDPESSDISSFQTAITANMSQAPVTDETILAKLTTAVKIGVKIKDYYALNRETGGNVAVITVDGADYYYIFDASKALFCNPVTDDSSQVLFTLTQDSETEDGQPLSKGTQICVDLMSSYGEPGDYYRISDSSPIAAGSFLQINGMSDPKALGTVTPGTETIYPRQKDGVPKYKAIDFTNTIDQFTDPTSDYLIVHQAIGSFKPPYTSGNTLAYAILNQDDKQYEFVKPEDMTTDPDAQVDPEEPVEPTEPSEPTDPEEPVEPTEPVIPLPDGDDDFGDPNTPPKYQSQKATGTIYTDHQIPTYTDLATTIATNDSIAAKKAIDYTRTVKDLDTDQIISYGFKVNDHYVFVKTSDTTTTKTTDESTAFYAILYSHNRPAPIYTDSELTTASNKTLATTNNEWRAFKVAKDADGHVLSYQLGKNQWVKASDLAIEQAEGGIFGAKKGTALYDTNGIKTSTIPKADTYQVFSVRYINDQQYVRLGNQDQWLKASAGAYYPN